ncbi:MAG: sulfate ABC transporter substrate-binding protein [Marmoricola sp.]
MRNTLTRNRLGVLTGTAVVAALSVGLTACAGTGASTGGGSQSVSIVGFSVLKSANAAVIKDFQSTAQGKNVTFTQSYDASGAQSRAVLAGLPADEVHLSLEPDVTKLVDAGIVPSSWNAGPNKGIVTQSVVVLVVRKGNPKHITGWNDLIKPGIKVVTPNPGSSGSAKWNILAAYGSQIAEGKTPAQAKTYLKALIKNVATWPDSGSKATAAFVGGTGDVLISYENEAIAARRAGDSVDYIVPSSTLLIQNPGAVTKNAPQAAKDFLAFQLSSEGQKDYATYGFRPLTPETGITVQGAENPSNPFPTPAKLLTIDKDFGGWKAANKLFFGDNGLVTKLIAAAGAA